MASRIRYSVFKNLLPLSVLSLQGSKRRVAEYSFRKRFGLLILLLLFPLLVHAERSKLVGCHLESCITIAFSNHPLLGVGEARQSAAQALLAMKKAERMPTLNLEGSIGYFLGKHITPFSAIIGELTDEGVLQRDTSGSYYRTLIKAQVPIFKDKTFLGQVPHAVRQAQSELSREEWENQARRFGVALKVAEAYIQVLKTQKAVKAHEEIVSFHTESYNVSQAKFKQGLIAKNDLLMEEVHWVESKQNLSISKLRLRRSQETLSSAMGLSTYEVRILDLQELPPSLRPIEELVALARRGNPVVKAQQFKIEKVEEEVEGVVGERYPAVFMGVQYGAANDLPTAFSSPTNDQWMATVDMTLPLFDGTLIRKKAAFVRARLEEEKMLLLAFESDLEQQIRTLYLEVQAQKEEIALLTKKVQQMQETLKLNQALFQQKLLSASEVHHTKALLLKLQLDQSDAVYDQHLNFFKLIGLSGEKIPPEEKSFKGFGNLSERTAHE